MSLSLWAPLRAQGLRCALIVAALMLARGASAHVTLDSPNGGVSYTGGQTVSIDWRPDPPHDTLNWDLWYSTDINDEQGWIPIATDLPVNEMDANAALQFDWVTPLIDEPEVWVRVRQDNGVKDYYDISENSFAIVPGLLGDLNRDGFANVADYPVARDTGASADELAAWQRDFGAGTPQVVNAAPVPEPGALVLLLSAAVYATAHRRAA